MLRFLTLSIPLLVMVMALFGLAQELVGIKAPGGLGWHPRSLGMRIAFYSFFLESVALTALFLLARGRSPARWMDGLLAGWLAWLLRGPLVVLGIASFVGTGLLPWRQLVFGWWVLYTLCGCILAWLAKSLDLETS